ncbi:unnamed protein product [Lactuca virosa]|uniref:Phosphatidylinositol 4-phosphate 5-kinase n=1 Tax=Lactuca virosa TaxID=75947 RepID=A0AAU9P5E7_9ASTR|nr:unnamed protein product [Lactuca virosa]
MSNLEIVLKEEDVYSGNVKGMIPHGKGTYKWKNGTVYEGCWEEGKMAGDGRITWSSGASYEGNFYGGYLHGFGTLTNPDGSTYIGSWRLNIQHGFGRKQYSNSDVYDGSWREGVHEGSGKYTWCNGDMYMGSWKGGLMCGRGVMKWLNGDLFDGNWSKGYRHGTGVYRFADGNYYFGTWTNGLKDGLGMFYPAISIRSSSSGRLGKKKASKPHSIVRSISIKKPIKGLFRDMGRVSNKKISVGVSSLESSALNSTELLSHNLDEGESVDDYNSSNVVWEREYIQGVLVKERTKNNAKVLSKKEQQRIFLMEEMKRKSTLDIFESRKSNYMMLNLQLGIRYTVGKITPLTMREVRYSDFGEQARIRIYFPRKGSQSTPPHNSVDFYWKDYSFMVFRNLRELFKLDAADYMMSICGDDGLIELSSPGKSGSLFYRSHDDRFVIKTLRKSELKVLLKMLPNYYNHVQAHDNTMITKFYGIHEITPRGGKKVQFVVMGNMFYTDLRIHRHYDLKGSYYGRNTNTYNIIEATTLKDLDLTYKFHMDKSLRDALFKQINLDCMFLESQQIIDYSLLLGLHFRAPEHLKSMLEPPDAYAFNRPQNTTDDGAILRVDRTIQPTGLLLVTHEPDSVNTAPGPHSRGSTLKAFSVGDKEVDVLLPGTGRLRVQLGVNMPAQANHKVSHDISGSTEVELFEVYDVVLYLGIIDILQEYNTRKKIEHAYKSVLHDPMSISVAPPKFYSNRFFKYLEKVFPSNN